LHAPSITTVQDPRQPCAYSEDVTPLRIAPDRMAALSGAQWVDICVVTRQGLVDSSDGRQ